MVFCESVGGIEGYAAGRGLDPEELQRMIKLSMKVGNELTEAADKEVELLLNRA